MSTKKATADALRILTAPSGPCDPFVEKVKDPDMMLEIIKESLEFFVSQNPSQGHSPEQLAEAFLHHVDELKRRPR